MYNTLLTLLMIDSVLIIISVMMQPAKTDNASTALSGGAADLFSTVLGIVFFALALALVYISSH